jgi:methanogenic corrinoid protein MtbC1
LKIVRRFKISQDAIKMLADLQAKEALEITKKRLDANEDPNAILADLRAGMVIVEERLLNR